MGDQDITCSKCGHKFKLDEALTNKLSVQLKEKLELEYQEREEKISEKEKNVDILVKQKMVKEKEVLKTEAEKKVKEEMSLEVNDLRNQVKEKEDKLKESETKELELLKKFREVKEKEEKIDLEVERKVEEKSKIIENEVKSKVEEEFSIKVSERDQQIKQMNKTIDELKKKGEQGSMQVQGDAQEEDLKESLTNSFCNDQINDVKTGQRGADIIQKVFTNFGENCGSILWESKNQKNWSNEWVRKLKTDQVNEGSNIAIIVTRVMPEGTSNIINRDGVWIVEYRLAIIMAGLMRKTLLDQFQLRKSMTGTDEKMKQLHNYLTGTQFKTRIECIVQAFQGMNEQLEKEQSYMKTSWNRRKKEIERVIDNTTGLYGDLQDVVGPSLASVEALELPEAKVDVETADAEEAN